ncbi:MAG: DsrE family protein [bacterium]|nr:DsrE family protein [bacterium]
MKLGILVNTNKHVEHVVGITAAARSKGHEVIIFAMDEGTRLLHDPAYVALTELDGVTMSFCKHSADHLKLETNEVPETIASGSQYQNAVMNHESDKVIIL